MKTAIELADRLRDLTSKTKCPSYERGIMNGAIEMLRQQAEQLSAWLAANGPGGWIDDLSISAPNLTPEEWQNLGGLPLERLRQMGFQMWDEDENGVHWLFPGEWFQHIPEGLEVIGINGEKESFSKHTTDDDTRFGALAFGFITPR